MPAHRKPLDQHEIDGTYRASRHDSRTDLQSPALMRAAPAHLSRDAAACWQELLDAAPRGAFGESDAAHLEACASALAHLRACLKLAAKTPLIAKTGHGPKTHPIHVECRLARNALDKLLSNAGLTPAARTKIVPLGGDDEAGLAEQTRDYLAATWPHLYAAKAKQ